MEFILTQTQGFCDGTIKTSGSFSKKAITRLPPEAQEHAANLIIECLLNKSIPFKNRTYACCLLGFCGSNIHAPIVAKILKEIWLNPTTKELPEPFENGLVDTLLRIDPEALRAILRDDAWASLSRVHGRLRNWSEREKALIYEDVICVRDGNY